MFFGHLSPHTPRAVMYRGCQRWLSPLVYNLYFRLPTFWSEQDTMIRFLQTPGPTKKIILSSLLLIICGGMVITLITGGLGSDLIGQPGQGVVAKVAGENITAQ